VDEMCQGLDALLRAKNAGILVVCRGFLRAGERKELVQIAARTSDLRSQKKEWPDPRVVHRGWGRAAEEETGGRAPRHRKE
jgi:hypothetical protein